MGGGGECSGVIYCVLFFVFVFCVAVCVCVIFRVSSALLCASFVLFRVCLLLCYLSVPSFVCSFRVSALRVIFRVLSRVSFF